MLKSVGICGVIVGLSQGFRISHNSFRGCKLVRCRAAAICTHCSPAANGAGWPPRMGGPEVTFVGDAWVHHYRLCYNYGQLSQMEVSPILGPGLKRDAWWYCGLQCCWDVSQSSGANLTSRFQQGEPRTHDDKLHGPPLYNLLVCPGGHTQCRRHHGLRVPTRWHAGLTRESMFHQNDFSIIAHGCGGSGLAKELALPSNQLWWWSSARLEQCGGAFA